MRVYELAKELGEKSTAFRSFLEKELHLTYPSHMSSMDEADVAKVRAAFSAGKAEKSQQDQKKSARHPIPAAPHDAKVSTNRTPKPQAEKKKSEQSAHGKDSTPNPHQGKKHSSPKRGEAREDFRPGKKADQNVQEGKSDRLKSQKGRFHRKGEDDAPRKERAAGGIQQAPFHKPNKPGKSKKNKKKEPAVTQPMEEEMDLIIEIPSEITVGDFARAIHKNSMEVITELIKMGIMAGLNESITFETAEKVAEKFGVLITEPEQADGDAIFESLNFEDDPKDLKPRPPVVTVMGHVDHGKTSLLDAIRETAVTRGEAGGITQHIGASVASVDGQTITFIDTPGHEAFTQMRSRGAQTTDIVILVVAADDGVMPQTIEAINHSKAAGVPIVVAINKMDKYGADANRVMTELAEQGLVPEEWGGDTIMIPVSAHTKAGLDDLLQMVLMVAEMEELKANPNRKAIGVVIEAQLEKGRGATASVLVQNGTLTDKDYVVSGEVSGHIRAMFDSKGKKVRKAGPSMPVKITGLSDLPEAGDPIYAVSDEKEARAFAEKVAQKNRDERLNKTTHISLDDLHMQISEEGLKELNIIVKTDVKGTIDALAGSIAKLSNDEVKVNIIHGAVGGISESDVMLAAASNAIIIGFNVRPNQGAIAQAEREEIELRTYRVIYEALDDIEHAIQGMLAPEFKEEILGRCEVRETFKVPNAGTVAGIYVTSGKIVRNAGVRLLRNDIVIHEGKISSLRRFKDDVKEVATSYEAGLGIENYNDIKVGDIIECFHEVEVAKN